jgi:hypothetical protein
MANQDPIMEDAVRYVAYSQYGQGSPDKEKTYKFLFMGSY